MKKILCLAAMPLLLSLFSCQEVIFDEIRKEVELEESQISGDVRSIVRFGGDIYLQNGNIWKKSATSESAHGWSQCSKPNPSADYKYVNNLAADSSYLYAQVTLLDEDKLDDGEIESQGCQIWYSQDGSTWEGPIEFTNSEGETVTQAASGRIRLFCTNAPKAENRKAYARFYDSTDSSYTVYELNGASVSALSTATSDDSPATCSTTPAYNTVSCAYFNNAVYFSSANSMATNESVSYTKTVTESDGSEVEVPVGEDNDATMLYYSSDDNIYFTMDGTFEDYAAINTAYGTELTENHVDAGCSTILSMSVTKDYLYLGTDDGVEHVPFRTYTKADASSAYSPVPYAYTADFSTNADSTLSSYYQVFCVLAMLNSEKESEGIIYGTAVYSGSSSSSSGTQENCGLWAYVPSRAKWNRE